MMRRIAVFGALTVLFLMAAQAQEPQNVPTLLPPTLVPYDTTGLSEAVFSESAIARIQSSGRVRIGVLFTEPPFGEFTERGEVKGLDADLARKLAEVWGVELRLRQVTRQTALELLASNDVDLLIAAQVHRRELDRSIEYSQTYYLGSQAVMVRSDDSASDLGGLNGRRIGVVLGSTSEDAVRQWASKVGFNGTIETFVTLDRLYGSLGASAVDAIVAPRHRLARLSLLAPDAVKILDQPLELEPYAIVFRRQDLPLRQFVNRTLQVLQASGDLDKILREHFNDGTFYEIPVWSNVGDDAPLPSAYSASIPYPTAYAIPRIQSAGVVRIAGPFLSAEQTGTATESERRLDRFQREFVTQLTRSWNVGVELINAAPVDAVSLVSEGAADLAIGLTPDWNLASQVDFSMPYFLHGLRLMVKADSQVFGFEELRGGGTVATVFNEPTSAAAAVSAAAAATARIEGFQTDESSLALQILEDLNADVAFADVLKLMPHLEAYPTLLRVTDAWYTQEYVSVAVPLNDADFRLLVDYSIQALIDDGTLRNLWSGLLPPQDAPQLEIFPGSVEFLGFQLD
ncbi:MAG: transporter substrate-binding domain-containing protein [Chloroflexi bacterium]|nr:transporter substrate-binding domain-containing protein [Chloroflexota bacterium]